MATGGYKLVKFSWQGGRTDSALDRCKFILHGFCSAIVDANLGWVWDDDLNPNATINDCKQMGGHTDNYPNLAYVLKLSYGGHVYRMCVALNYYNTTALREQDCVPYYSSSEGTSPHYQFTGTLYTGLVKDGTYVLDSTYGYIPDGGQYLKWMTFNMNGSTTNNGKGYSFAIQNSSDVYYSYYALIKNAQIAIFCNASFWRSSSVTTSGLKGYIMGEIFKETAHSSDLNTFACLYLCSTAVGTMYYTTGTTNAHLTCTEVSYPASGFDTTSSSYDYGYLMNTSPTNGFRFIYSSGSSMYYSVSSTNSQIFTADGINLCGVFSSALRWVYLRFDSYQVNSRVSSTVNNPGGRWTPCYVTYYCSDQDTYGIVQGDSFKGFVDTDLLRGVNCTYAYGQVLGTNGDFLYLGGGFAIGWDSSNTETLF